MDAEPHPRTLRIVLVGKTDTGKSSTGNTICGRRAFTVKSNDRGITFGSKMEMSNFDGQFLSIVDTPGLFDPSNPNEDVKTEIANGVALAAPGPHVLLVVIRPGKFTREEQVAVNIIQGMFGEKAYRYTMALFTRGDDLETDGVTIEYVIRQSSHLSTFISQCGGGYHVFNNRDNHPFQVRELLEKINTMVEDNGGNYFVNDLRLGMGYQEGIATAIAIGTAIGGVVAAVATTAGVGAAAAVGAGAGAATGAAMVAVGAGAGAMAGAAAGADATTFVFATAAIVTEVGESVETGAGAAAVAAAAAGAIGGAAFLAASAIRRIVGAGVGVTVCAAAGSGAIAGACAGLTSIPVGIVPIVTAVALDASYKIKIGVVTAIVIGGGAVCCGAAAGAAVGAYIDEDNAGADAVDRGVAVAVAAAGGVAGAAAGGLGVVNVALAKGTAVPAIVPPFVNLVAVGVAARAVRAFAAILF